MSDLRQSAEAQAGGSDSSGDRSTAAPASGISSAEHLACALHEVSNALTVVLGWLDMAEGARPEEAQRAIAVAKEHARRGQVMARRSIGAEVESARVEQHAGDLLRFAVTSIQPQAAARGVRLECECGPETNLSIASPDKVLQILTNLLMNALSFSPRDGTLRAVVTREADVLSFIVEDEGPGVEESRRASLFSSPTSTRSGGVGLGLPHSRHLAREAGGELHLLEPSLDREGVLTAAAPAPGAAASLMVEGPADSTESRESGIATKGARFELLWPVSPVTGVRSSIPEPSPQTEHNLEGARILVVEDDPAIGALVELSFSARGAEVIIVTDAEAFVRVLTARPVLDLVLLDLSPVDDALTEALDSLEQAAPAAPVILMSGHPNGIPQEAEGRFASWVRKPFELEELLGTASSILSALATSASADKTSS